MNHWRSRTSSTVPLDRLRGIFSLSRLSVHPAELESAQSEINRLEASLEAVNNQLSTSQAVVIVAEAECDHHCALIGAETHKRQDLEALLAEMHRRLDDHSSVLLVSHEMLHFDVNKAFHAYLWPLFDATSKPTVSRRTTSTTQVQTHGKKFRQRTSSIVSYLNLLLSSSVAVSNFGSTTSNPVGHVVYFPRSLSLSKSSLNIYSKPLFFSYYI